MFFLPASGKDEPFSQECSDSSSKPKQLKFPNQVYIDPDECIDCAVCVPECPAEAIVADTEIEGTPDEKWTHLNAELAKLDSFENITEIDESRRDPDRDKWDGVPNKLAMLDRGE